jgi:molybdopterin/thiamine biosynthesis adenylyltransferase
MKKVIIKFLDGKLIQLRATLLKDISKEQYGILLAKKHTFDDLVVFTVQDFIFSNDATKNTIASISLDNSMRVKALEELSNRIDVDSIIDVHTHPFAVSHTQFSSVDDMDEIKMTRYINDEKINIGYASIVFCQEGVQARYWEYKKNKAVYYPAQIKTQLQEENIVQKNIKINNKNKEIFDRSILALGIDSLSKIMDDQVITIVGVGGIGSIIAEHLVHMGFQHINLIDFDKVEFSNLNRLVGAKYTDAIEGNNKVDVVKRHITEINPKIVVNAYNSSIVDGNFDKLIATSDFIFMTTDNYFSCVNLQILCEKYYTPFISAATNILVEDGKISDMRGEIILVRIGNGFCLECINRIDKMELQYETATDEQKRQLVQKGYVKGMDVHAPAVKTLNSYVATKAVDVLVNQYTRRQKDEYIIVMTNNETLEFYEDLDAIKNKTEKCGICGGNN